MRAGSAAACLASPGSLSVGVLNHSTEDEPRDVPPTALASWHDRPNHTHPCRGLPPSPGFSPALSVLVATFRSNGPGEARRQGHDSSVPRKSLSPTKQFPEKTMYQDGFPQASAHGLAYLSKPRKSQASHRACNTGVAEPPQSLSPLERQNARQRAVRRRILKGVMCCGIWRGRIAMRSLSQVVPLHAHALCPLAHH